MTSAAADRATSPIPGLAVALTSHNSLRTLRPTLESVVGLAARIVVVDSGSTDGSVDVARACGATVMHREWSGHVAQKQFAIDQCADARWVFLLDSDEALDGPLRAAVRAAVLRDDATIDGYEVNRRLVLHGRALTRAFQPEWRLRLFRPTRARVSGIAPHDFVAVSGRSDRLAGDLLHDSWRDVDDMLRRQLGYATIWSRHAPGETTATRGGHLLDVLVRPGSAFLKQYVLKRGFRDGWRGLVAAGGAAAATLMKHLALAERRGLEAERSVAPQRSV
ncbi:MAG: glycosyltransferase family 2 protein [Phycisphaerales bacterium]